MAHNTKKKLNLVFPAPGHDHKCCAMAALMKAELERIAQAGQLSRDVAEQVEAALG